MDGNAFVYVSQRTRLGGGKLVEVCDIAMCDNDDFKGPHRPIRHE